MTTFNLVIHNVYVHLVHLGRIWDNAAAYNVAYWWMSLLVPCTMHMIYERILGGIVCHAEIWSKLIWHWTLWIDTHVTLLHSTWIPVKYKISKINCLQKITWICAWHEFFMTIEAIFINLETIRWICTSKTFLYHELGTNCLQTITPICAWHNISITWTHRAYLFTHYHNSLNE